MQGPTQPGRGRLYSQALVDDTASSDMWAVLAGLQDEGGLQQQQGFHLQGKVPRVKG